ncbi:hypothetical protein OC834_007055, partial [Tilletia horrida]
MAEGGAGPGQPAADNTGSEVRSGGGLEAVPTAQNLNEDLTAATTPDTADAQSTTRPARQDASTSNTNPVKTPEDAPTISEEGGVGEAETTKSKAVTARPQALVRETARKCGKELRSADEPLARWREHALRIGDLDQLAPKNYLKGELIELCMRYVLFHERPFASEAPAHRPPEDDMHLFGTYVVRQYGKHGYDAVRRAMTGRHPTFDIFSKKYLIFPIFEEGGTPSEVGHWLVLVVAHPSLALQPCKPEPGQEPAMKPLTLERVNPPAPSPLAWSDSPFAAGNDGYPAKSFPLVGLFDCSERIFEWGTPYVDARPGKQRKGLHPSRVVDPSQPIIFLMDSIPGGGGVEENALLVQMLVQEHAMVQQRPELKLRSTESLSHPQRASLLSRMPAWNLVKVGVPVQPNSYDCGPYSVFNVREFFKQPDILLEKAMTPLAVPQEEAHGRADGLSGGASCDGGGEELGASQGGGRLSETAATSSATSSAKQERNRGDRLRVGVDPNPGPRGGSDATPASGNSCARDIAALYWDPAQTGQPDNEGEEGAGSEYRSAEASVDAKALAAEWTAEDAATAALLAAESFADRQRMPPPVVTGIDKTLPMLQSSLEATVEGTRNEPRPCGDCGATFSTRNQLWNHFDKIHRMVVEDVEVDGWTKPQQVRRVKRANDKGEEEAVFCCPKCSHPYESGRSLKRHAKECKHEKAEPSAGDTIPQVSMDRLRALAKQATAHLQRFEAPNANQTTPWATRTGFMKIMDGQDLRAMSDMTMLATEEPTEKAIAAIVADAIRAAADKLDAYPTLYAQMMNAKDISLVQFTRPLNAKPSTLEDYLKMVERLVLFVRRADRLFQDSKTGRLRAETDFAGLSKIFAALNNDSVLTGLVRDLDNGRKEEAVWAIGEHVLCSPLPDDAQAAVFPLFLASLGIVRPINGNFLSAGNYTPMLSRLLYCFRLCFFVKHITELEDE